MAQQHDSPCFKHKITQRLHDDSPPSKHNVSGIFLNKTPEPLHGDRNDDLPTNLVTNGQPQNDVRVVGAVFVLDEIRVSCVSWLTREIIRLTMIKRKDRK